MYIFVIVKKNNFRLDKKKYMVKVSPHVPFNCSATAPLHSNFLLKHTQTFKNASVCISLHGISTIFAVNRMDSEAEVKQSISAVDNPVSSSPTIMNSTVTLKFLAFEDFFLLYNGKTRGTAQPRANAD